METRRTTGLPPSTLPKQPTTTNVAQSQLKQPTTAPATTNVAQSQLKQPLHKTEFKADGTTTKQETAKVPTSSGGPVKGGVLGFLLSQKTMTKAVLSTGDEIVAAAKTPSMRALFALRAEVDPVFAPQVEVTRKDGSTITGLLKGADEQGRAVFDIGFGKMQTLDADENLSSVRHHMTTNGDLHAALVTVFDQAQNVSDPWQLQGFVGKKLVVETYDAEHPSLAVAAKKGDVSAQPLELKGVSKDGLELKSGGTLLKEFWNIAKVTVEQPGYSYKQDGMRLSDVAHALARGTAVDVALPQNQKLSGVFLGVAKDAEGSDYLVVQEKNGARHALRDVIDVKAAPTSLPVWQHADYRAVYPS